MEFLYGWTHNHYVTKVFVFAPDETSPISFFNVPECVHDSLVADWCCIYQKLEGSWENTRLDVSWILHLEKLNANL